MIVYKDRLLKESWILKLKLVLSTLAIIWLSNIAFHLQPIWFQSTQNHARHCFKLLLATIWSHCAAQFESEQTPFPQTGRRLGSAALHRKWFGTGGFVPMSYFYSETNGSSKDWAKRWALLWSATTSRQLHPKFHLTRKKGQISAKRQKLLYCKSGSSSSEPYAARSDCRGSAADSETPCVCAAQSDPPKMCLSAAPRAWSWILQSKPSIVFRNSLREWLPDNRQELENPKIKFNKLCRVWILFRKPKLRTAVSWYKLSSTRLYCHCLL